MPRPAKRTLAVDTTDPVFDVVYEIAQQQYPGARSGPGTVLRELCITALASGDVNSVARATARRLAYLDGLAYIRANLGHALSEIGAKMRADAQATEALLNAEKATMIGDVG